MRVVGELKHARKGALTRRGQEGARASMCL